uniref:Uncharacterized protein n=1 Tax=Anopheles melas TaxID=34690 RepID=A0A182UDW6_9DIPT
MTTEICWHSCSATVNSTSTSFSHGTEHSAWHESNFIVPWKLLVDRLLAWHDERGAAALQRPENVAQYVQHLVGRFEMVRTVHVVDVIDRLLQMVGRILHLLYLPRVVLGDGGALDLLLLPLHLKVDVLGEGARIQ